MSLLAAASEKGRLLGHLWLAVVCGACSGPPKKAPQSKPKPPPVVLTLEQASVELAHYIEFTPQVSERVGLLLSLGLYDKAGKRLAVLATRVGPRIDRTPLRAGSKVSVRLKKPKLSMRFKVVGGERPAAQKNGWRFEQVDRIQLEDVRRCTLSPKTWYPGMTLAAGSMVPRDLRAGDRVYELTCRAPASPRALGGRLEHRRAPAARSGAFIRFSGRYHQDFEQGVVLRMQLSDERGRIHPGCEIEVRQPGPVYALQTVDYRLNVRGQQAASLIAAVKQLKLFGMQEGFSGRDVQVALRCGLPVRRLPRSTVLP
jgi:hypothetical protein